MKYRCISLVLAIVLLLACLPQVSLRADAEAAVFQVFSSNPGVEYRVRSVGRYINWAGVSNASQFIDENGRFCFALDGEEQVTIYKTADGAVTGTIGITKPYPLFGGAICDSDGYFYLVWGENNATDDTSVKTVFVSKYDADGNHVASVGGNGKEGLASYYDSDFYTKYPFSGGNCDIAINGNLLAVNYARKMYSGHQSNGLLIVDKNTMTVQTGIKTYNSHSFDQRVTPYTKTGGFLLQSQGDCFPRCFATAVTGTNKTQNEIGTFHFWVEENAYTDWNMGELNCTRARLGNILETSYGAALIAASAKSMTEDASEEPYDLFVQVFDPSGSAGSAATYVTSGTRTGLSGPDGNKETTDYGVFWLTDLQDTGLTIDVVQAVSIDADRIGILYELENGWGEYDSTWFMILNGDGSVYHEATQLPDVRLNTDEDPVFADGYIQWVSNQWDASAKSATDTLQLHRLEIEPHHHEYKPVVTEPTCTEQGFTTYTCACGDSYVDDYVPALGHDIVAGTAVAPTCTEPGLTAGGTCTRCGYTTAQEAVPALGHDLVDHEGKAATCTAPGWDAYQTCSRCDYSTYEELPALGHDLVTDAAVEATCTETGLTEGKHCTRCDFKIAQEETPALGHDLVVDPAIPATCTASGLTAGERCKHCDYKVEPQIEPAIGHIWNEGEITTPPTETEDGVKTFTCPRCGCVKIVLIPATGEGACQHEHATPDQKDATCAEDGYDRMICDDCGKTVEEEIIPAFGHLLITHEGKAPTCTEPGCKDYQTCSRCDYTTFQEIAALGHDLVTDPAAAATCTEPGLTEGEYCTRCDYKKAQETIPALEHDFQNGKCTRCGEKDPDYKPVVPASFIDVSSAAWYYDAVNYAVSMGLMNGVGNGRFAPDDPMTRAMLVTVLWRYEGSPYGGQNYFSDVQNGQWYTDAVTWAAYHGIVGGVGNGKFDPNGNITREQMAAILYRYANRKGIDTSKTASLYNFPDWSKVSDWAKDAIAWTVAEGIIGGSDGWLLPQGNATRAQVSTILMRFIEDVVNAEPTKPTEEPTSEPTEPTNAPTEPTSAPTEPTSEPTVPTEQPEDVLPDFSVKTITGETFTLSEELKTHKLAIINLFATWCGPCEMEFPYMQEAWEQSKDRVALIALSIEPTDTDTKLTYFAKKLSLTIPMGHEAGTDLGRFVTEGIPTTLVVDGSGRVVAVEIGAKTSKQAFLDLFDEYLDAK